MQTEGSIKRKKRADEVFDRLQKQKQRRMEGGILLRECEKALVDDHCVISDVLKGIVDAVIFRAEC